MRYYIVGYMYAGKTTYGRRLAAAKGMSFVDMDALFEERYHYTVPRFFAQFGEAAFRTIERQLLYYTATLDDFVIATGGGTPCFGDNMDFILQQGTAIYLQLTVEQLYARALISHNPRPLMRGLSPTQIHEKIASQLKEREGFYLRAQVIVDGNSALPDIDVIAAL